MPPASPTIAWQESTALGSGFGWNPKPEHRFGKSDAPTTILMTYLAGLGRGQVKLWIGPAYPDPILVAED